MDPVAFERLQREVTDLRLQIREELRTGKLVVVDDAGVARARITASSGGDCHMVLFDEDGFERIALRGRSKMGVVEVAARSHSGRSTQTIVFANDPVEGDGCQVGVHLIDTGNEVGGFHVYEGEVPRAWVDSA